MKQCEKEVGFPPTKCINEVFTYSTTSYRFLCEYHFNLEKFEASKYSEWEPENNGEKQTNRKD